MTKGFCQVKKILKIREKLGLVAPHPPTPIPNFYFFATFGNMKTRQKSKEFQKKKIRVVV